jgi:hypothetical protein
MRGVLEMALSKSNHLESAPSHKRSFDVRHIYRRMSWSFLAWCAQVQSKNKMSVSPTKDIGWKWRPTIIAEKKSVAHCRGDSKEKNWGDSRCIQNAETTRPYTNKLIKFHHTEDVTLKNLKNEVTIVLKSVGLEHDQKLEAPASLSSISLALDYCAWRVSSTLALQEYSLLD